MRLSSPITVVLTVLLALAASSGWADEGPDPEEKEAQKITEKYWNETDGTEVSMIQDRYLSKSGRVELSIAGGSLIGSPFLTSYTYGGAIGYHASETFSFHASGWGAPTHRSRAIEILEKDSGNTANVNRPSYYLGGEVQAHVLDGKLGLADAYIFYFEFILSAGAGRMATDTGSSLALTAGIGQALHLSRNLALNLDVRLIRYRETILEQRFGQTTPIGQPVEDRTNLSCVATLGLSVFL